MNIESDDQVGFFMVETSHPPLNQASAWFHNSQGKTVVSSQNIIPLMFFCLSYPFHIHYGKKRVKKDRDHGTAIFCVFSSPPILLASHPRFSFLTNTCYGDDKKCLINLLI